MSVNRKPLLDVVLCWLAFAPCAHLVAQQAKESEVVPFKIEVKVNKVLVPRFIVFLFDDMHLGADDLGRLQKLRTKILAASLNSSDMAAAVSISGANSGLPRDRAKLEEAIMNLKSRVLYRHQSRQCPDIDYYEADLIENKRNGTALEAAVQQTLACANLDPQTLRKMAEDMVRSIATNALMAGDQDVRVMLATLREFVRKMGTLPGQRTLILISPGFLTLTAEAMTEKTRMLD